MLFRPCCRHTIFIIDLYSSLLVGVHSLNHRMVALFSPGLYLTMWAGKVPLITIFSLGQDVAETDAEGSEILICSSTVIQTGSYPLTFWFWNLKFANHFSLNLHFF